MIEALDYVSFHPAISGLPSAELQMLMPTQEYLDQCEYISSEAYTGKELALNSANMEELKSLIATREIAVSAYKHERNVDSVGSLVR